MPGEKILIVEDSMIVSNHLRVLLSREGYQITGTVTTGEEAITAADKTNPDLILMDIMLAGVLTGIDAAREITQRHHVPIIYLTALTDKQTLELAKATGPVSYIIKPFDENDLTTRIEIALFKARVERENELKNMAALIEGQEIERSRVSRELHDGLGQVLHAIQLHFDSMAGSPDEEFKKKISKLIHEAVEEVRRISDNLLPRKLMNFDLSTCISSLCKASSGKNTEVVYQTRPFSAPITEKQKLILYRITQEALQNAMKHSTADKVFVQLYKNKDELLLTIEDNGKGFTGKNLQKGLGLENIRYRTEMLSGTFHLESTEGKGTLLSISIPLNAGL
jgi:signal transduction histidine kinase